MSINNQNTEDRTANQEQQEGQRNNRRLRGKARMFKAIVRGINTFGNLIRIIEFFGDLW